MFSRLPNTEDGTNGLKPAQDEQIISIADKVTYDVQGMAGRGR